MAEPQKQALIPVYEFTHFRKNKETGKNEGKPAKLAIYSEPGTIDGGYANKGKITLSLDNGKEDKEHQKIWFKMELGEVSELIAVLTILAEGHIRKHSERITEAFKKWQESKSSSSEEM